jgi:hypothetical protein
MVGVGLGCSSPPPEPPPAPKKGNVAAGAAGMLNPAARGAAGATAAAAGGAAGPAANVPADLRKKALKDEDFVESLTNRDPFHSFISELTTGVVRKPADYEVYFDKYACEELKLIAVVTGDLAPRALFRDPVGYGQSLKVGDHMCKAHWRIKRIVADGVVVELEEDTGGTKPKLTERQWSINSAEDVKQ